MAKVTMPLMSGTASGKFGKDLVFDVRGRVRRYVSPTQPNSAAQLLARLRLSKSAKAVGMVNSATLMAYLRGAYTYTWHGVVVGQVIDRYEASETAYNALPAATKTAWTTAFTDTSLHPALYALGTFLVSLGGSYAGVMATPAALKTAIS
jgi:hypothetical protein